MKRRSPIFRNGPEPLGPKARVNRILDWVDLLRIYKENGRLTLDDVTRVAGFSGHSSSVERQRERRYSELKSVAASLGIEVTRRKPTEIDDDPNVSWSIVIDDVNRFERTLSRALKQVDHAPEEPDEEPDPLAEPEIGLHKTRVAAGLCAWCKTPVERLGDWYCKKHAAVGREACRRRRARRLEAGLCQECGVNPNAPGKTRCTECLRLKAECMATRRDRRASLGRCTRCRAPTDTGGECLACAQDSLDRVRKRQDRLVASGLCATCGKRPIAVGRSVNYCVECSSDYAAAERDRRAASPEYREKRLGHLHAYRERLREQGVCPRCGTEPLAEGKKTGRACLDKLKTRYRRAK